MRFIWERCTFTANGPFHVNNFTRPAILSSVVLLTHSHRSKNRSFMLKNDDFRQKPYTLIVLQYVLATAAYTHAAYSMTDEY